VLRLELHVLPKHEFDRAGLFTDIRLAQATLEQVSSVLRRAMLNLRIHIDRPDVHALGVVRNDTFEHSAASFSLSRPILQNTILANNVDVE